MYIIPPEELPQDISEHTEQDIADQEAEIQRMQEALQRMREGVSHDSSDAECFSNERHRSMRKSSESDRARPAISTADEQRRWQQS